MRVNVETRAIKASKRLSARLSISQAEALGRMVLLWEGSQDEEVCEAKNVDIISWIYPEFKVEELDIGSILRAMTECGFIKEKSNDVYEICGNDKHIDKLLHLRKIGKKGGESKKQKVKHESKRALNHKLEQMVEAKPKQMIEPNTIQCNATQRMKNRGVCETELVNKKVSQCVEIWRDTLKHFGINRDGKLDEIEIARGIQRFNPDDVARALKGCRDEEKTDNFDPAKHLSIRRVLSTKMFDKFVLLGSKENGSKNSVAELSKQLDAEEARRQAEYDAETRRLEKLYNGKS